MRLEKEKHPANCWRNLPSACSSNDAIRICGLISIASFEEKINYLTQNILFFLRKEVIL